MLYRSHREVSRLHQGTQSSLSHAFLWCIASIWLVSTITATGAFVIAPSSHPMIHSSSASCTDLSSQKDSFQDGSIEVSRSYRSSTTSSNNEQNDDDDAMTSSTSSTHELHYRIHNRMNLSSQKAAPVLILHGGPGIPSDYLYPLTEVIPYRSLIFYDQLGCGRSPGPDSIDAYSIDQSIDDLELLIKKLNLRRFHLYGQSFGGILAFEYIKRMAERIVNSDDDSNNDQPECLSVILSSAPYCVETVEASANKLIEDLLEEDDDTSTIAERFRLQNQCRIHDKPQPLVDAYAHSGTVWRGTDVIQGWKAEHPTDRANRMPSTMIMRGEYDFVSQECIEGWKKAFNHPYVRVKVLEGCSHHGLLENGNEYGDTVDSFFAEYD